MTALTENRYTKHRDGLFTAQPVKAGARIYRGSIVCVDATGFAVPGNDKAGLTFVGIAIEEADNTGGLSGAITVRVQCSGIFSFAKTGMITQTSIGATLYIADDQTLALAVTTQNDIPIGKLEALDDSDVWCRIKV